MINNFSLQEYSTILAVGSILILIIIVIHYFLNKYYPHNRLIKTLHKINSDIYIKAIFLLSLLSLISAIIYETIYHTPVCPLCWWQRVFIIPTIILSFLQLRYNIKNQINIISISIIGLAIALYHYWLHYATFVLGLVVKSPCSGNTFLASCVESPILIFKAITIPFMSIVFFLAVIYLSIQSYKKYK